jgi:hypothetical protein
MMTSFLRDLAIKRFDIIVVQKSWINVIRTRRIIFWKIIIFESIRTRSRWRRISFECVCSSSKKFSLMIWIFCFAQKTSWSFNFVCTTLIICICIMCTTSRTFYRFSFCRFCVSLWSYRQMNNSEITSSWKISTFIIQHETTSQLDRTANRSKCCSWWTNFDYSRIFQEEHQRTFTFKNHN